MGFAGVDSIGNSFLSHIGERDEFMSDSVGRFFDSLAGEYTEAILRCFPRYDEMLWALLEYLPDRSYHSILELGCGTGNLTVLATQKWPEANLLAVDLSADSIDVCRSRLADRPNIDYRTCDFRDLEFNPGQFDLVISSISIHHLNSAEKQTLFRQIEGWLQPGGVLGYVDQFASATAELSRKQLANWKRIALAAGSTNDEWQMWMQHAADHDHHDTLADQMAWLNAAGFGDIDCPWRYLLWTLLTAEKSR